MSDNQNWISIADQNPEKSGLYLIVSQVGYTGASKNQTSISTDYWCPLGKEFLHLDNDLVLYWMKIPTIPNFI